MLPIFPSAIYLVSLLVSCSFHLAVVYFPLFSGLIATSSDAKGADDVKLITSLAESYIKKESCIILLTVTCESMFVHVHPERIYI